MTVPPKDERLFDDLFRAFELYTKVQLEAETIYYNRSNLILVAQGLLFVALPQIMALKVPLFAQVVAGIGTWLSAVWWVLEQRHLIHHESRETSILRPLEVELTDLAMSEGRGFRPFWANTAAWVDEHARWYQRHSVRTIIRSYAPLTFLLCWAVVLGYLLTH
jgi:hypothetical protein